MKKTGHVIVLFALFFNFAFTQEISLADKEIDSITKQMFVDINNRDFDAILERTHPKVFDILPKESMKQVLKTMFEGNTEYSIDIPKEIPDYKISKINNGNSENSSYAFITYDMKMNMTFHQQEFDDEAKEMMVNMMKMQDMDVEFISDNTLKVLMKNRLNIILKDNSTNDKWVSINYDPDSPLFYQVLSSELIEKAKEYKQNTMLNSKHQEEN